LGFASAIHAIVDFVSAGMCFPLNL